VIFAVIVPALWIQVPLGMRELARQGFGFGDLRSGLLAIDDERRAVVEAMRADPRYAGRQRRKLLLFLAGISLSVLIGILALTGRRQTGPTSYTVSPPAMFALILAVCLSMICMVFGVATLASTGRFERRLHALWVGKAGQLLFRLGAWRLQGTHLAGGALTRHGALTMLDSLDADSRRRLPRARVVLERLEGGLEGLERREQELLAAVTEAKASAPTQPASLSDRQRVLLDDLDRARRAVVEKRTAMLAALENIRLSLVRLKSRLGTAEDVERELAEATRLLQEAG
jgi:hypothetical protein